MQQFFVHTEEINLFNSTRVTSKFLMLTVEIYVFALLDHAKFQ